MLLWIKRSVLVLVLTMGTIMSIAIIMDWAHELKVKFSK